MTRVEKRVHRKRRRWLRFWARHWKPLPAFHTYRTIERLYGDDFRLQPSGEVGRIEGVRFREA
jgi:hypothetical protein